MDSPGSVSHGGVAAIPGVAIGPFLDTRIDFLLNLYLGLLGSLLGSELLLVCPLLGLLFALLRGNSDLVLLHGERCQALLGLGFGVNVTFFTGLADDLLEGHHLGLDAAVGLTQAFTVGGHVLLLELLCTGLDALGVFQGCLLAALGLAQARGQLVDAFLDALAVLVQLPAGSVISGLLGRRLNARRLRLVQHFSSAVLPDRDGGRIFILTDLKFQVFIHGIAPLHVQNVFRTVYDSQNFVVVQQTNLTAVDWDASTRISSEDDPVTFLAPRAGGKFALVGISKVAHLQHIATHGGQLRLTLRFFGQDDTALGLFRAAIGQDGNAPPGRFWNGVNNGLVELLGVKPKLGIGVFEDRLLVGSFLGPFTLQGGHVDLRYFYGFHGLPFI